MDRQNLLEQYLEPLLAGDRRACRTIVTQSLRRGMNPRALYNELIWPAQTAAYALGAMLIYGLLRPGPGSGRTIATILAVFWIWTGLAFHWAQYSIINFAAPAFAALFVAEGFLIAWSGVLRGHLQFQFQRSLRRRGLGAGRMRDEAIWRCGEAVGI